MISIMYRGRICVPPTLFPECLQQSLDQLAWPSRMNLKLSWMPLPHRYLQVATGYENTVTSRKQTQCVHSSVATVQVDGQILHTSPLRFQGLYPLSSFSLVTVQGSSCTRIVLLNGNSVKLSVGLCFSPT